MKPGNRFNPQKLDLSKWTARQPRNREKHFLVSEVVRDEEGQILEIELQAVLTRRCERMDWRTLQDQTQWQMGWH